MDKRYQVFISSTFADLEEERKGIMQAIIELDCFPAGMEMFPATDSEQFEYIKTIIDESDYYVLIVAGRYGSIAEDGISYTEKEFDYAKEKGVPILAFAKNDIKSIPVDKTDDDFEKQKKLEIFRTKVLNGRMASFWDTADELKYKIHSSLSKEFKVRPRNGWVRGNAISSYETLEQLNQLQEENRRLILECEDFKNKEKLNNDRSSNISKLFIVDYTLKTSLACKQRNISINEIVNKAGLLLKDEVWLDDFEEVINEKFFDSNIVTEAGTITNDSLQEIEKKMLALGLIDIRNVHGDTLLRFTEYGNEVFIRSIEF